MRFMVHGTIVRPLSKELPIAFEQEIDAPSADVASDLIREKMGKAFKNKVMITHIWGLEFSVSEAKIQSEAEYYQGEILVGIEDMLQYHDTIKDMQTKRDWIAVTFNDDSTIIITVKPNKLIDDS